MPEEIPWNSSLYPEKGSSPLSRNVPEGLAGRAADSYQRAADISRMPTEPRPAPQMEAQPGHPLDYTSRLYVPSPTHPGQPAPASRPAQPRPQPRASQIRPAQPRPQTSTSIPALRPAQPRPQTSTSIPALRHAQPRPQTSTSIPALRHAQPRPQTSTSIPAPQPQSRSAGAMRQGMASSLSQNSRTIPAARPRWNTSAELPTFPPPQTDRQPVPGAASPAGSASPRPTPVVRGPYIQDTPLPRSQPQPVPPPTPTYLMGTRRRFRLTEPQLLLISTCLLLLVILGLVLISRWR